MPVLSIIEAKHLCFLKICVVYVRVYASMCMYVETRVDAVNISTLGPSPLLCLSQASCSANSRNSPVSSLALGLQTHPTFTQVLRISLKSSQ